MGLQGVTWGPRGPLPTLLLLYIIFTYVHVSIFHFKELVSNSLTQLPSAACLMFEICQFEIRVNDENTLLIRFQNKFHQRFKI